jgi:hypothetical protein
MLLLLLAFCVATWAGCDSFLDTEPLGEPNSETFFGTPAQAVQATNATYGMLRNWQAHVFAWLGMTDIVSDDTDKGSTPDDAAFLLEFENLNWTPSNGAFLDTWGGYYEGIYRANIALQGIEQMENIDPQLKSRLLAENRFLRAYYYYFLVRAYGGVPLFTEPVEPGAFEQQRSTADSVYALIEEDLTFAAQNLPEKSGYGTSDLGRATRGAAQSLLTEAHLFQEEYAQACQIGQEVIASGEYSLVPDYSTIFTPEGENSSESVFEIQAVAVEEGTGGVQYSEVQGVRGTPNLGWGFNQPSDDLTAAFEPGDPRQQATIMFPWELLPYGNPENMVVWMNSQINNQRYNQKSYIPPNNPGGGGNGGSNIRRIRYSHVLLNTAEACFHAGNEPTARDLLNDVRERARNTDVTLGFTPELLAESVAGNVLGLDAGAGRVFVRYVDEDSWAFEEGLRSFTSEYFDYEGDDPPVRVTNLDVIQSVDGTPISTVQDYYNALSTKAPGQSVVLQILRVSQSAPPALGESVTQPVVVTVEARELLPDITAGGQDLLEAIWNERRVELALEQHRWFDIIRQNGIQPGRAAQVMQDVGKTFEEHQVLYPIPQSEVDLVKLEQNPGYN